MKAREAFGGMRLMRRVRCRYRIAFLASIGVHVDPDATGRRARIVDQMLVCSARPHCRCCAPGVDEFTCECVSPFEPLTRRERRRPGCIYCGAPMHGVRS